MRINPILSNNLQLDRKKSNKKDISFKSYNLAEATKIEREIMARHGILTSFEGNDFVAKCIQKVIGIYNGLFGRSFLPKQIYTKSLPAGIFAAYNPSDDGIKINSNLYPTYYQNLNTLKAKMNQYEKKDVPSHFSTSHPAHIFVHEFGHCAHWHNLEQKNGFNNALKVWRGLVGSRINYPKGREAIINELSTYSLDDSDLCEFLAEKITKDICTSLTGDDWVKTKNVDVGYSDIFSRKWKYRYSSNQSYIDYFVQQVWNGNLQKGVNEYGDVKDYLADIEYDKVPQEFKKQTKWLMLTPELALMRYFLHAKHKKLAEHIDKQNKIEVYNK